MNDTPVERAVLAPSVARPFRGATERNAATHVSNLDCRYRIPVGNGKIVADTRAFTAFFSGNLSLVVIKLTYNSLNCDIDR